MIFLEYVAFAYQYHSKTAPYITTDAVYGSNK
jgi:hypothetical protein